MYYTKNSTIILIYVYGHTLRVTPDFLSKGEPVNLN